MSHALKPFEISEQQIEMLDQVQLVQLIKRLAFSDLHQKGVPLSAVHATLKVTVPDGGEDIRVEWTGGPERTDYIPNRVTIFQSKAENLPDAKFKSEPIDASGKSLKPAVLDVVNRNGAYVIDLPLKISSR